MSKALRTQARKLRKAAPPELREVQRSLRLSFTFKEAAGLIAFKLTDDPEDFAGYALEVFASDVRALLDLVEPPNDLHAHEDGTIERMLDCLEARIKLAIRLNEALKKAAPVEKPAGKKGGNVVVGRFGKKKKKKTAE